MRVVGERVMTQAEAELLTRLWAAVQAASLTVLGPRGGRRLSAAFAEWMMGLPEGHVTGTPGVSRVQQLRMLGNGVVPQQAEAAVRKLMERAVR